MMKMKLDERQQFEILKIERAGFWILFLALAADLLTKTIFFQTVPGQLIGENIAFAGGCIIVIAASMKKGLWTSYSTPCLKDYLVHSLVFTIIFTPLFAVALSLRGAKNIGGLSLIFGAMIFLIMAAVLSCMGIYTKKKQIKLEKEYDDD